MSDEAGNPGGPERGQDLIDRRALSRRHQYRIAGSGAAILIIGVAAVWFAKNAVSGREPAAVAPQSPPGTFRASPQQMKTFSTATVALRRFVSEEITDGKIGINGDRATPVYSPYSGRVTRVIAELGDTVNAGSALATIEAAEFAQAQSDLAIAAAQVRLARIMETRKHALYEAKGGSLQDWQQAQSDLFAAETAANAVRNRLAILGKSPAEIAALEGAKAGGATAALRAPIAGVVVDRQVGPGQFVQAGGSTPLFTIADPSSVWLLANVRETDAGMVHVGQAVEVHVLAYPRRTFQARLTHVAAVIDPASRRFTVRAEIDNADGALKPEMFANFRILTGEASESPAVPEAAVVHEGDGAHVWVIGGDGLIAYRAIRAGRSNDGSVEVLEGLAVGEHVVTRGSLFIDQAAVPSGK